MDILRLAAFISIYFMLTDAQCPPPESIPKCTCSDLDSTFTEKVKVVCDGVSLKDLKLTTVLTDLTLKNGGFSSLKTSALQGLPTIGKLTLINNGLEKIIVGDLKDFPKSIREFAISDARLQTIDDLVFNDLPNLESISITDSIMLQKIPKLKDLKMLQKYDVSQTSVKILEPNTLMNLPNLKKVELRNNKIDIFDLQTFGDLPAVKELDLSGNILRDVTFLPFVLRRMPQLNYVFLRGNKIPTLPDGFLDGLQSLLLLDLSNNVITKLPSTLATKDAAVLRELYLDQNYITQIPQDFFQNISSIRTLSIANNTVEVVYKEFYPLKDLLYLRLQGNRIQFIEGNAFKNLARAELLSLAGNNLKSLQKDVFAGLNELRTLDLSGNTLREFQGTEIVNMTKLENLIFANNKLRTLYAGFESLVALKVLDLSNNELSYVADNTWNNLLKLETLRLEGNLFSKIPFAAFGKLSSLEKLTLENNVLQELTAFPAIGHIKYLSLHQNVIPEIPTAAFANLPELRHLYLQNNRIRMLQEGTFANLNNLYVLNLASNIIQEIQPKAFGNLVSLETLDLSGNQLEELSNGCLGNTPMLRSADFSRNQIGVIEDEVFNNLGRVMQMNISKNYLNIVPAAVRKLQKMRKLDFSWNRIRRVENTDFRGLETLELLYLHKNPICSLADKAFTGLPALSSLDLSNTDLTFLPESAFKDIKLVTLDGVRVDCDCRAKWLRLIKDELRCNSPGSVRNLKISQIDPNIMTCDKATSSEEQCSTLPVAPSFRERALQIQQQQQRAVGMTTEAPEVQILGKGSLTEAWLTLAEREAKQQELDAIQKAKLTAGALQTTATVATILLSALCKFFN